MADTIGGRRTPDRMTRPLGPDLVSEEGLRELVRLGHQVVVICLESAERRGSTWYGLWGIRCVSRDGSSDRVLVTYRRDKEHGGERPRTFRTLSGLVGFLYDLGFRTLSLPFNAGERVAHTPDPGGAPSP